MELSYSPTFMLSNSDSTQRHWLESSSSNFSPPGDEEVQEVTVFASLDDFRKHTESLLAVKKG